MVRAADAAASFLLVKMGHVLGLKEYLGNDSSPLLQKILNTATRILGIRFEVADVGVSDI
jgi:hypothetical protein